MEVLTLLTNQGLAFDIPANGVETGRVASPRRPVLG
jgi:hypothetical protein